MQDSTEAKRREKAMMHELVCAVLLRGPASLGLAAL
jgi:hypothetical protein